MTTLHDLISATIRTKPDADPRRGRHLGELLGIPTGKGRAAVEEGRAQPHAFPLTKVSVRASILADCAVTELEERYTNDSTQVMDVTHTIPLPPDGAVTAFEIVAGGRTVKGVRFVDLKDAGDPVALAACWANKLDDVADSYLLALVLLRPGRLEDEGLHRGDAVRQAEDVGGWLLTE
jgi:hypothetical protein